MNNRYQYDRIEAYIIKALSDHEMAAFEQDLKSDKALLEAYKIQLLEHEAMENMIAKDLKSKMAKWKNKAPANPFEEDVETIQADKDTVSKVVPLRRFNYGIAAGLIALIAAVGYWFFNQPGQVINHEDPIVASIDTQKVSIDTIINTPIVQEDIKSNTEDKITEVKPKTTNQPNFTPVPSDVKEYAYNELIKETVEDAYEIPEELFSSLKSDDAPNNSPYRLALRALNAKEYNKALDEINKSTNLNQSSIQYLFGHIYFGQRKYNLAEQAFGNAAKNELTPTYQEALWFQTLSLAAQLPKSKDRFDDLTKRLLPMEDFNYKREVNALMEKLNH